MGGGVCPGPKGTGVGVVPRAGAGVAVPLTDTLVPLKSQYGF